jgi:uncharacterized protein YjbI with pentapeptide repeats
MTFRLDGEVIEQAGVTSIKFAELKNFDFAVFRGYFFGSDDENNIAIKMNNASFYGATPGKSIFYYWAFTNCDFRYANFDGADFEQCKIDASCKFKGAKINGSKIHLLQEQLLSTDPFIKERIR